MRITTMFFTAATIAMFASSGCKKKQETAGKTDTAETKPDETKPATDPVPDTATPTTAPESEETAIPTEEDYEETAILEVTTENLEAELAKLEKELGE